VEESSNRGYLVRQLSDHKAAINPSEFRGGALTRYARVCGEVFAKAHARTARLMRRCENSRASTQTKWKATSSPFGGQFENDASKCEGESDWL
jgi:Uncharacterized protein conserved in bacteria (DUF2252)